MIARIALFSSLLLLATPAGAVEYSWNFRTGHFDNRSLVPTGPGAVNLLQPTDNGLRISIPAGHNVKAVGFSPRFRIEGDFEIAVEFTILHRTQPKNGHGTGPNIYLSMGSTQDAAASLGRVLRPDGRDVYGVFAARLEQGERRPTARLFDVPGANQSTTGRLHLKRIGEEITYSVADDLKTRLRPLAALPVGRAEVAMVRIGLAQSEPDSSATMLIHSIRIAADDLPQLPSEQSRTAQLYRPRYQPPPKPKSYRWLWQCLAGLAVVTIFSGWLSA